MNTYELSRKYFDWCFENPERIKPIHTALYFFIIEHCNRLGWKQKFGLPTSMAKEAIGVDSYNTYIKAFNDLVEFGFIQLIEKSRNQYSSNIIAISNFNKSTNKALDKALVKHDTKQSESKAQSIDSIDKQETINKEQEKVIKSVKTLFKSSQYFDKHKFKAALSDWSSEKLKYYYEALLAWSEEGNKKVNWIATAKQWAARDEREGKVKFTTTTLPDWRSGKVRLSEQQYKSLSEVHKREYNQIISGV